MGDRIAQAVIKAFDALGPKGKPQGQEKGILAGLVLERAASGSSGGSLEVVAIGTGSGCVSADRLGTGGALRDGHAEVVCRRAFVRYLYGCVLRRLRAGDAGEGEGGGCGGPNPVALRTPGQPFHPCANPFVFSGVLHLYVSQRMCGDCCVNEQKHEQQPPPAKRARVEGEGAPSATTGTPAAPRSTGARRVVWAPSAEQRARHQQLSQLANCAEGSAAYADFGDGTLGAVRNKPGRGPLSASMSCSDKVSRWCALGLQGCLLGVFLPAPVAVASVTLGGVDEATPVGQMRAASVRRSLARGRGSGGDEGSAPEVTGTSVQYACSAPDMLAAERTMCGYSIGYSRPLDAAAPGAATSTSSSLQKKKKQKEPADVVVSCTGFLAGATKKAVASGAAASPLCGTSLLQLFAEALRCCGGGGTEQEGGGGGEAEGWAQELLAAALDDLRLLPRVRPHAATKRAVRQGVGAEAGRRREVFFASEPFSDWVRKVAPSASSGE